MPDTLLERLLAGTVRDETLTRRAVAFVLSGEDPEVIKTIRQRQPIGRGHAPTMGYEETYDALAWLVALGDPGALVRFARIQWVAMPGRSLVLGDRTWPELCGSRHGSGSWTTTSDTRLGTVRRF